MARTLVVQSHRTPLPAAWLQTCLASVCAWSADRGFDYRFLGDELFDPLSPSIREQCAERPMVAADLGRLHALTHALDEGYDAAIWCDADLLVIHPDALELPEADYAVGREVWVHERDGRPRAHRQVHNAMLLFRRGNPLLPFYLHAAQRIVSAHRGPMVPQLVGPKLLTALHNLVQFPVIESANVLSPPVLEDLLAGGGPYLDLFRERCTVPPAALNLCASLSAAGRVPAEALDEGIAHLLRRGL